MAYVHFEDMSEMIVSTELALQPEELVAFLVKATLQQQNTQQHQRARSLSCEAVQRDATATTAGASTVARSSEHSGYDSLRGSMGQEGAIALRPASVSAGLLESGEGTPLIPGHTHTSSALGMQPSQLTASRDALHVARQAVRLLEDQVAQLEQQEADGATVGGAHQSSSSSSSSMKGLEMKPVQSGR